MSKTAEEKPRVNKTEDQWRQELTPEQFQILRLKGTERPFTGKYWDEKADGSYVCAACGQELFTSETKFDSGCGWPSFFDAKPGAVKFHDDFTHGMKRVEVTCSNCGGHLGHIFPDGPRPTGQRFCINSASIDLQPTE